MREKRLMLVNINFYSFNDRWTKDTILQTYKFCSVYRVADHGSQYLIKNIIEKGSQELTDVFFRVLLYNIFTKIETFQLLDEELGPLQWRTYDRRKYYDVLQNAMNKGMTIYTGAFQKPAPSLGHKIAFRNHLELLNAMMDADLLTQLMTCEYMADAFDAINQFPGMGNFNSFQLLIDLSYTPVLNFSEDDFVIAGVGAVQGLKKCFSPPEAVTGLEEVLMRWMRKDQDNQFARLGLTLKGWVTGKREMTLVDIEHTLCEVHKYSRMVTSFRNRPAAGKRFEPSSVLPDAPQFPKAWSHPDRERVRRKPGKHIRCPKRYVISSLMDKRINEDGGVEYLVDWLGYEPKDRTWEPEAILRADAPVAVEEYEEKHASVGGATNRTKSILRPNPEKRLAPDDPR